VGAHPVPPDPAGGGKLQQAGQLAIIGEQQQAFRVDVETANGNDAGHLLGHLVEHRWPVLLVAVRDHKSGRL
jgi:hypothetical protein